MSEISPASTAERTEVDLFGAPFSQIRERWGRPAFRKTKENQELVALLRAAGWSHYRISRYLGCDEKTLRKYFSRELEQGADLIEAMALQVMLKKMREGNSVATGRILEMIDKGHAVPPPAPEKSDKAEDIGKKAAAEIAARSAHEGTEWGELLKH